MHNFEILDCDAAELSDRLVAQVRAFNKSVVGYIDSRPLSVAVRNSQGELVGGLSGRTVYRHLLIEVLWVAESERLHGLGRQLMERAEQLARERGCVAAQVDTLSFQAPEFYRRLGFEIVGCVADFPPGHARYYLRKPYSVD